MHPSNDGEVVHVVRMRPIRQEMGDLSGDGTPDYAHTVRVFGTIQHAGESDPSQRFIDEYYEGAKAWGRDSHKVTSLASGSEEETAPGFGRVRIGMTLDELLASGDVTQMALQPGCADRGDCDAYCETYGLVGGGTADMAYSGNIVGQIVFDGDMATPEGIREGSSERELLAAYPNATARETDYPDNTEYKIAITEDVSYFAYVTGGRVGPLLMSRGTPICFD